MRRIRPFALSLTLAVSGLTTHTAHGFDQIVAFGDSLSDTGNLSTKTFIDSAGTIVVPFSPPYYATFDNPLAPPSPTNPPRVRFSNGPVWVERLADNLSLPLTNYAYGGSRIGTTDTGGLTFDLGAAQGLPPNTVVTDNLTKQTADYLTGGLASGSTVYTFLAGANDFGFDLASLTADPTAFITDTVGNLAASIGQVAGAEAIANNGADVFLVSNLPDLSQIPLTQIVVDQLIASDADAALVGKPALLAGVSQGIDGFNDALVGALFGPGGVVEQTGANIQLVDLHGLFNQAIDPSNPFGLANQTDPFYTTLGSGLADGPQSDLTADPLTDLPGYLFFDVQHPTAGIHAILGDAATPLVPEPAQLLVIGGGLLLGTRRRR